MASLRSQACELRAASDRLARDKASLGNELASLRDALSDPLVPISGAAPGSPLRGAGAAATAAAAGPPAAALRERLAAAEAAAEAAAQKAGSEERAAARAAREWQLERQQLQVRPWGHSAPRRGCGAAAAPVYCVCLCWQAARAGAEPRP